MKRTKVFQLVRGLLVLKDDLPDILTLFEHLLEQPRPDTWLAHEWWQAVSLNKYWWTASLVQGLLGLGRRPTTSRIIQRASGWERKPGGYLVSPWLVVELGQERLAYPYPAALTTAQLSSALQDLIVIPLPTSILSDFVAGMQQTQTFSAIRQAFAEPHRLPEQVNAALMRGHAPAIRPDANGRRLDTALLIWNGWCLQHLLGVSDAG